MLNLNKWTPDIKDCILKGTDPKFAGVGEGGLKFQLQSGSPAIALDAGAYKFGEAPWAIPGYKPIDIAPPVDPPVEEPPIEEPPVEEPPIDTTPKAPVEIIINDPDGLLDGLKIIVSVEKPVIEIPRHPMIYDSGHPDIIYTGSWTHRVRSTEPWHLGTLSWSNAVNSKFELEFTGSKFKWLAEFKPWHGRAGVTIDNGPEEIVNLGAGDISAPALVYEKSLQYGSHKVSIRVVDDLKFVVNDYIATE
jgi:hypothetical protein